MRGGRKRKGGGRDHNIPARGETNYVRKRRGKRRKEKSIYRDPETSFQCMVHCKRTFLKGGENASSGRLFVRRGTCLLTNEVLSTKVLLFPPSSFLRPPNGTQQERDSFISFPSSHFLCCRRRLNGRSPFAVLIFTQVREWVLGLLCGFLTFPKKGGSFEAILGSSLHSRLHSLTASRPPDLIAFRAI